MGFINEWYKSDIKSNTAIIFKLFVLFLDVLKYTLIMDRMIILLFIDILWIYSTYNQNQDTVHSLD